MDLPIFRVYPTFITPSISMASLIKTSCFCSKNSQILFFFVKVLSDRMTISLQLFLEKLAILLIFAHKDEHGADPNKFTKLTYKIL